MEENAKEKLIELNKTSYGKAVRDFVEWKYKTTDTVKGLDSWEEAKRRQGAVEVLDELLRLMNGNKTTKVDKGKGNIYT